MRFHILLILICVVVSVLGLSSCVVGKDTSVKVYEEGTRVEAGHLIYTVFETQWLAQLGTGDTARAPKNRFFIVRVSVVNSGSEELIVPNLRLQDDQGNVVEELSDGEGVAQWLGYIRKVKPTDSISGNIIFDAEPKHYALRVTDENEEKPAMIDLPLNFSAGAPQFPAPGGGSTEPRKK